MTVKNCTKGNQPKVYIGGINDGGGIIISPDRWGGVHIKRIPPRQPELQHLMVASNLMIESEKIENPETRRQVHALAEQIAKEAFPAFEDAMEDTGVTEP